MKDTVRWIGLAGLLAGLSACRDNRPAPPARLPADATAMLAVAVKVPAGRYAVGSREPGCTPPREVDTPGFAIWPTEIPRAWWADFRAAPADAPGQPATSVSYEDAEACCRWLSERYGLAIRLPTVDEWEIAARAGVRGLPYSSGWADPAGRVVMAAEGPKAVNDGTPNRWGLWHMSGNVAEWCRAEAGADTAPVVGGSWAERDARWVRISHRMALPKTYRDGDVGFRVVIDMP